MKTLALDAATQQALEEAAQTVGTHHPRFIAIYAIQAVAEAIVKRGHTDADILKGLKVRLEEPDEFEADLEALLAKKSFSPPL
jgi:uncharacterized protein (DUF1778 family)